MNIKLTQLSHGGGCGCKISPGILKEVLAATPLGKTYSNLLVGIETGDDAAVYRLNSEQAIVATTDFFTPIVDDPYDFGRIAATNALSDIYAMGGQPIMALAIVGMPLEKLPVTIIQKILQGGESVCHQLGIPIAGGHSIDTLEPIYGLVALGLVHPNKIKRNSQAQVGDSLILAKPLGVGVLSAALKKGKLSAQGYEQMIQITTQLNTPGSALADMQAVHALTDVTGFGLLGHLLGICRGSGLTAQISFDCLPVIPEARDLLKQGYVTGASARNWQSYGNQVTLSDGSEEWYKQILTDPQTSGGLLVACAANTEKEVLHEFYIRGFNEVCKIGTMVQGEPRVMVTRN